VAPFKTFSSEEVFFLFCSSVSSVPSSFSVLLLNKSKKVSHCVKYSKEHYGELSLFFFQNRMKKTIFSIIGAFFLTAFFSLVRADGWYEGNMMNGSYGGGMGYNFFSFLIFWGAIITIGVFVFRYFMNKENDESPLDILKKRFAKGDITEKEFEEMRKKI